MTSGGPRRNSGATPQPNALRRDRPGDADWVTLPAEGFQGTVPPFPLPQAIQYNRYFKDGKKVEEVDEGQTEYVWNAEGELWAELWRKPQAAMWSKLGMEYEVAAYVRAFLESVQAEASAGLKTAALRMSAEIGLSLPGMHSLRWKFSEDELASKREALTPVASGARARMARLAADS